MKKTIRLTESELTRIVNSVLNENRGPQSLGNERDELRNVSQRTIRSMDEYQDLLKKGDYKRLGDEVDNLRRMVRRLKDITQQIESKI